MIEPFYIGIKPTDEPLDILLVTNTNAVLLSLLLDRIDEINIEL